MEPCFIPLVEVQSRAKYLKLYYNGLKANYFFPGDIELKTPSIFCPCKAVQFPGNWFFFQGLLWLFPSFSYMENNTFIEST